MKIRKMSMMILLLVGVFTFVACSKNDIEEDTNSRNGQSQNQQGGQGNKKGKDGEDDEGKGKGKKNGEEEKPGNDEDNQGEGEGNGKGKGDEDKGKEGEGEGKQDKLKPEAPYMASRLVASWRKGVQEKDIYSALDVYKLMEQPSTISADVLKPLLEFHSSMPDGSRHYKFTDDEVKQVGIEVLPYIPANSAIELKLSYKGAPSTLPNTLLYSQATYYEYQIEINQDYVKSHAMRGINSHPTQFFKSLFTYDESKCSNPVVTQTMPRDQANTLTLFFTIEDPRYSNPTPIALQKDLKGFLPLEEVLNRVTFVNSHEMLVGVKEFIAQKKDPSRQEHLQLLNNRMVNKKWLSTSIFEYNGEELNYDDSRPGKGFALSGLTGDALDVYLDVENYALTSAVRKGNDLTITLSLQQVNGLEAQRSWEFTLKGVWK